VNPKEGVDQVYMGGAAQQGICSVTRSREQEMAEREGAGPGAKGFRTRAGMLHLL
jgi:hypothetical protein